MLPEDVGSTDQLDEMSTRIGSQGPKTNAGRGPFLIVGLGNPGLEYLWTPHNAGFMAIDRIAQQEGVVVQNRRCRANYRDLPNCRPPGGSGQAGDVHEPERRCSRTRWFKEFEADPAHDLLVIYDELDLVLGTFKIRERGSPAGHNGARSVTGALGSEEWLRLRIGVGLDLPPEAIAAGAENGRAEIFCSRRCAKRI